MKSKKAMFVVAALAGISASFCIVGCGTDAKNNKSDDAGGLPTVNSVDTYVGTTSAQAYNSESDAVKAFFDAEFGGKIGGEQGVELATFDSYENVGSVDVSKASRLGITDSANVKNISAVNVKFNAVDPMSGGGSGVAVASAITSAAAQNNQVSYLAYIAEYLNGSFKYFSPRPSNGDLLTRSYWQSLTQPTHYINCTGTVSCIQQDEEDYLQGENWQTRLKKQVGSVINTTASGKLMSVTNSNTYLDGVLDHGSEYSEYYIQKDGRIYRCSYPDSGNVGDPAVWLTMQKTEYFDFSDGCSDPYKFSYGAFDDDFGKIATGELFGGLFDAETMEMIGQACSLFQKTPTGFKATDKAFEVFLGADSSGDYTTKQFSFDIANGMIVKCGVDVRRTYTSAVSDNNVEFISKFDFAITKVGTTAAPAMPAWVNETSLNAHIAQETQQYSSSIVADAAAFSAAFDYSNVTNYTVSSCSQTYIKKDYREYAKTMRSTEEYRDGDSRIIYSNAADDWSDDAATAIYRTKTGDQWYEKVGTSNNYGMSWQWGELSEAAEPSQSAPLLAAFGAIVDKFDRFRISYNLTTNDVPPATYVAVIDNVYYEIGILNGKVVYAVSRRAGEDLQHPEFGTSKSAESTVVVIRNIGNTTVAEPSSNNNYYE